MVIDMERNEDLTKVFDRTWKANHNNDVKEVRSREKKFWNKMLNVKDNGNANTRKIVTIIVIPLKTNLKSIFFQLRFV